MVIPGVVAAITLSLGSHSLTVGELDRAATYLAQANRWAPNNVTVLRRLARLEQLRGRPEQEVAFLKQALVHQPDSLLLRIELLDAYLRANDPQSALEVARTFQYEPDKLEAVADSAFYAGQYTDALKRYRLALLLDPQRQEQLAFRMLVASGISGDPQAQFWLNSVREADPHAVVTLDNGVTTIDGGDLRWMVNVPGYVVAGDPLSKLSPGPAGKLFWAGEAAAVIDVPRTGQYLISASLTHMSPPPILMGIGVDGQAVTRISLDQGNQQNEIVSFIVSLRAGVHTVSIWFYNNALVPQEDGTTVDRDARVVWVTVEPLP